MARAPRFVAVAVAGALVLAACSDDDSSDDAATTAATEVEGTVAATTPATAAPETTSAPETTAAPESTVAETTPETTPETTAAPETTEPSIGSIVDVATEAGSFTTLLAAADAAGLTEELATRELTLLAPTDDAFAALGQETIDALLTDPEALAAVLRNHMLPVPQDSEAIVLFTNVLTVDAGSLLVAQDDQGITIGGARVVTADIPADNGIIHVIDAVLVPAPAPAPEG